MPKFGKTSEARLSTCDDRLQQICNAAIKEMDFTVLCGHRTEQAQNEVFDHGLSRVRWPNSKHNSWPSRAVDLAPYPIDWADRDRFLKLADLIIRKSIELKIEIRWGADWNRNGRTDDERFLDYPHFELAD